jgi:hypothetical protein
MKPTVSEQERQVLMTTFRTVVSKVAKVCFRQKHHFPDGIHQSRFSHISISYQSHTNHGPRLPRCVPFVCQSLWFYLLNKKFYHVQYVCQFQFLFPQVHAFHSPFDVLMRPHSSLGSKWHCANSTWVLHTKFGTLCKKISRIRCVLSRILHSYYNLEYFAVMEIIHHQISMLKFHFFT